MGTLQTHGRTYQGGLGESEDAVSQQQTTDLCEGLGEAHAVGLSESRRQSTDRCEGAGEAHAVNVSDSLKQPRPHQGTD